MKLTLLLGPVGAGKTTFGYTLIYVDDVVKTMNFYEKAFGLEAGFLHESKDYGEMKTGERIGSSKAESFKSNI